MEFINLNNDIKCLAYYCSGRFHAPTLIKNAQRENIYIERDTERVSETERSEGNM